MNVSAGGIGGQALEELWKMLPLEVRTRLKENPSDTNSKRRIVRMLERLRNGEDLQVRNQSRFNVLQLGVHWEKEILARRIDERLSLRLKQGMVEEVQQYLDGGGNPEYLYQLGLEYRYIAWYLAGRYASSETFREELSRAIKQFAKRQVTWFKRDPSIHWLDMQDDSVAQASRLIDNFLREAAIPS